MQPLLLADGGEMIIGRRFTTYTWGAWQVTGSQDTTANPLANIYSEGYVYLPDHQHQGRFDILAARADCTINITAQASDVEKVLDAAQQRGQEELFFEKDIETAGLGHFQPGVDFQVGDIVNVAIWGKILQLPVTTVDYTADREGEIGWRVHVGGQLIEDAAALAQQNSEILAAIAEERSKNQAQTNNITTTLSGLTRTVTEHSTGINSINQTLTQYQNNFSTYKQEAEEKINLVETKITETAGKIDGLTTTVTSIDDGTNELRQAIGTQSNTLKELDTAVTTLNTTLNSLSTSVEESIATANSALTTAQSYQDTIDTSVTAANQALENSKSIITELTSLGLETAEGRAEAIRAQTAATTALEKATSANTNAIANLNAATKASQTAASETQKAIENLNKTQQAHTALQTANTNAISTLQTAALTALTVNNSQTDAILHAQNNTPVILTSAELASYFGETKTGTPAVCIPTNFIRQSKTQYTPYGLEIKKGYPELNQYALYIKSGHLRWTGSKWRVYDPYPPINNYGTLSITIIGDGINNWIQHYWIQHKTELQISKENLPRNWIAIITGPRTYSTFAAQQDAHINTGSSQTTSWATYNLLQETNKQTKTLQDKYNQLTNAYNSITNT